VVLNNDYYNIQIFEVVKTMAYYDKIANHWHKITGYSGGAFKKYILNDRIRSEKEYERLFRANGFDVDIEDIYTNQKVLNEKPGLAKAGNVPIATIYNCRKRIFDEE
jgi:hypothetical protein